MRAPKYLKLERYTEEQLPELLVNMALYTVPSRSSSMTTQSELSKYSSDSLIDGPLFFDQVSKPEALTIYSLVRTLKAKNTLEIGFCCGGSTLAFLKAHEDSSSGMHYAIDPYQTSYASGQGLFNVRYAGLAQGFQLFESTIATAHPHLPNVQCAFIDSSHLFDLTLFDFILVDKLLDVGGILIFHDAWMAAMQKLIRYILANRSYELLTLRQDSSRKAKIVRRWSYMVNKSKLARYLLAPEILTPWVCFEASNIVLVQKIANDERPWKFHCKF